VADEHPVRDPAGHGDAALVAGYEQLRAAALSGGGGGHELVVLATRGMAAWMAAWRCLRPSAAPPRPPLASAHVSAASNEVVAVLASMAAACIGGG
jgi:hypothetical protein